MCVASLINLLLCLNNVLILFILSEWPKPILTILFKTFGFIAPKTLIYLGLQSFDF